MSDVRVIGELFSFVIDPQVYGYDTANLFTTVTGTPAISTTFLRLPGPAEFRTKAQYLFGEYVFNMKIPVAPTAADARSWGLKGVAVGNRAKLIFNITDDVFSVLAYDNNGTLIQQIVLPWDADWTATATEYRIAWSETGATFRVVGSTSAHVAQANIQFGLKMVNIPNFLFASNTVADNVDIAYIGLNNVGRVESLSEVAAGSGGSTSNITQVGGVAVPTAGADAVSNTRSDVPTSSRVSWFNGTTWDRARSAVITPSATLTGFGNVLPWAIYNATPTTRTEGQGGPLQTDTVGNINTTLGTTIAGEQVTLNYLRAVPSGTPTYISTATTTLVKSGAGVLTELVIGKHVATGVIQIYDGLTAVNLVATITTGAALLNDPPFSTLHGMVFNTGLTIVTSQAEFVTAMTI